MLKLQSLSDSSSSGHGLCVVLASVNNIDEVPLRVLQLDASKPERIGRASKKGSKRDSRASETNGFINSPVISRSHAELSLTISPDDDTPRVFLKDNSSMHGTFLNQQKLVSHVPHRVNSGDTIQFGFTVVAKANTYVAPRYRVAFSNSDEIFHSRPSSPVGRTFVAPVFDSDVSNLASEDEASDQEDGVPQCLPGSSQTNPITFDEELQLVSISFPNDRDISEQSDSEDIEPGERREWTTNDDFTPLSHPVLPNLSPARATSMNDISEEVWPESDPLESEAKDDCEAQPSSSEEPKSKLPCPDLKNVELPSNGKMQKSRFDLEYSVHSPCVSKKRKADDITDHITSQQNITEQAYSHPATVSNLKSRDSFPITSAKHTESTEVVEPAMKKTKFSIVQFTSGMVLGAVGVFAAILALPEDF